MPDSGGEEWLLPMHRIGLADRPWIDEIVFSEGARSADFAFGNMYIWDSSYPQWVCRLGGRMIVLIAHEPAPFFACPIGSGPLDRALAFMGSWAARRNLPLTISGVTEKYRALLEARYPGRFSFREDSVYADYIYSAQKLAELPGGKYHGKRNHIRQFEARFPRAVFAPLTREHIPACRGLLLEWAAGRDPSDGSVHAERLAAERAFADYEALGFDGGVLLDGGRLLAFTIGERVADDTFLVHFEKASAGAPGAYAVINRDFVRWLRRKYPAVDYINREDDLGLENLRRAKMSYHPEFLEKKYTAALIGQAAWKKEDTHGQFILPAPV